MKTLIVGCGEVGRALEVVLKQYDPSVIDQVDVFDSKQQLEIIHICFPYTERFIEFVKAYQVAYQPTYTVIHSTVPIGTSQKLNAIHSPIRGIHPNLEEGIRTFQKFLGGQQSSAVADYFRRAGLKIVLFDKSETTEAMKLWDTQYYKRCIEFAKEVKEYCDKHSLSFHEVYTLANLSYNEGYKELGHPEFQRPILQPIMTPIGGHCIKPNHKLLYE